MRTAVLAILFAAAAFPSLVIACNARSDVDCTSGDERECGMCPTSCFYVGCGQCGPQVAIAVIGFEQCTGHGTWGPCSCLVEVEAECTSESTEECAQQCSLQVQSLGFLVPDGGHAEKCREAYVALLECAGESCGWIGTGGPQCQAELQELDQECLGLGFPGCY
ncbi:MAG: hypothetical protein DRI90_27600 [Deltaproteobacteria bacterium]|nr:MAG: hypothetical protein DRI90_27600 [Deltaproteobacteria bacterium]